jgi:hypothetical protein
MIARRICRPRHKSKPHRSSERNLNWDGDAQCERCPGADRAFICGEEVGGRNSIILGMAGNSFLIQPRAENHRLPSQQPRDQRPTNARVQKHARWRTRRLAHDPLDA